MKVVTDLSVSQSAVNLAREILRDAEAGEIVSFTIIAEYKGGRYRTVGTTSKSRLEMAGALFEAAMDRLGYVSKE
jgi:hypothetical protein